MPGADAPAGVTRDGEALHFAGALVRDAVPALWRQALPLVSGARRFDLAAVDRVDSAGVAMLAELSALAARAAGGAIAGVAIDGAVVDGEPAGLAELRAAYRLQANLDFA